MTYVRSHSRALLAGMLAAAVYGASHPYWGLAHDARLYMAQALQRRGLADLSTDLFFVFGSQDSFTIYTWFLGHLVPIIGVSWTALAATATGAAAMLAATHAVVRKLAGTQAAWVGTIFVAALPGRYSALGVPLVEPYATPRSLACALILFGVAAVLGRRHIVAAVSLVCAMLFHPLMALPGIAWVAFTAGRFVPVLVLGLGTMTAMIVASVVGIAPFDRLITRIDDDWRLLIEDRSPYLYLLHWEDLAWSGHSGTTAMVVIASLLLATRMEGPARRIFLTGGAIAVVGALATLIGGDWLQSALVVQLQPWRAIWIASFLTLAGTGMLLVRVATNRNVEDTVVLMGVGSGLMLQSNISPVPVVVAAGLLIALVLRPGSTTARWSLIASFAVLLEALTWCLLERSNLAAAREISPDNVSPWPLTLRDPFLWLAIGLLAFWGGISLRAQMLRAVLAFLIPLALGLVVWDWHHAMQRNFAHIYSHTNTSELVATLPTRGPVYWDGDPMTPWFELGHPSYVSVVQTAGIVFHRETAIEAARRTALVATAAGSSWSAETRFLRQSLPKLDLNGARILCRDAALAAVYVEGLLDETAGPTVLDRRGRHQGNLALCERLRDG